MQGSPTPLSLLGSQADAKGNASGKNLRRVRVREKRCARSASWRTATFQQIFGDVLRVHNRDRKGFAYSRWADTGGGCCSPIPISTFYF